MSNETKQTAMELFIQKLEEKAIEETEGLNQIYIVIDVNEYLELKQQAKEMEKEQMRLDIEKKWQQYRIITNNEDAWSFKEWLIKQTYGNNK